MVSVICDPEQTEGAWLTRLRVLLHRGGLKVTGPTLAWDDLVNVSDLMGRTIKHLRGNENMH